MRMSCACCSAGTAAGAAAHKAGAVRPGNLCQSAHGPERAALLACLGQCTHYVSRPPAHVHAASCNTPTLSPALPVIWGLL